MAVYIAFFKFYDLYHNLDTNIHNLGFTAPIEKWAVKWIIWNVYFITFILCQLQVPRFHFQRHPYNMDSKYKKELESLLKFSTIGIALTAAWIPCFKAYPILSVILMCLEMSFLSIGPLFSISFYITNLFHENLRTQALERLIVYKFSLVLMIGVTFIWNPKYIHRLESAVAVAVFSWILILNASEDFENEWNMEENQRTVEDWRQFELAMKIACIVLIVLKLLQLLL